MLPGVFGRADRGLNSDPILAAHIRSQHIRNDHIPLRGLERFHDGDNRSGESKTRPIECVQELRPFTAFRAKTQVGATGLEVCLLYTSRAHETDSYLVCRLLLEKKK